MLLADGEGRGACSQRGAKLPGGKRRAPASLQGHTSILLWTSNARRGTSPNSASWGLHPGTLPQAHLLVSLHDSRLQIHTPRDPIKGPGEQCPQAGSREPLLKALKGAGWGTHSLPQFPEHRCAQADEAIFSGHLCRLHAVTCLVSFMTHRQSR